MSKVAIATITPKPVKKIIINENVNVITDHITLSPAAEKRNLKLLPDIFWSPKIEFHSLIVIVLDFLC
jgi:hypothetical protein